MNSKLSHGMHTKKNLDKSEKNHMEGQNWLMKTILQWKRIKKQKIFKFQCSMMIHFQDMIFFSGLSKFFLCAYRGSILNLSLGMGFCRVSEVFLYQPWLTANELLFFTSQLGVFRNKEIADDRVRTCLLYTSDAADE